MRHLGIGIPWFNLRRFVNGGGTTPTPGKKPIGVDLVTPESPSDTGSSWEIDGPLAPYQGGCKADGTADGPGADRGSLGLHRGERSKGCIAVPDSPHPHPGAGSCWGDMQQMLAPARNGSGGVGFLKVQE